MRPIICYENGDALQGVPFRRCVSGAGPCCKICRNHWPGIEIALNLIAAEASQDLDRFAILDAFGQDDVIELLEKLDNVTHNNAAGFFVDNMTHNRPVEFDDVQGHLPQVINVAVSRTKVIQKF